MSDASLVKPPGPSGQAPPGPQSPFLSTTGVTFCTEEARALGSIWDANLIMLPPATTLAWLPLTSVETVKLLRLAFHPCLAGSGPPSSQAPHSKPSLLCLASVLFELWSPRLQCPLSPFELVNFSLSLKTGLEGPLLQEAFSDCQVRISVSSGLPQPHAHLRAPHSSTAIVSLLD